MTQVILDGAKARTEDIPGVPGAKFLIITSSEGVEYKLPLNEQGIKDLRMMLTPGIVVANGLLKEITGNGVPH